MNYKPPFQITPLIFQKSQEISRALGMLVGQKVSETPLKLRRTNNIKTIQSSLAIEGNTLSLDHVTALCEGKRVIGPAKDILEVKNALSVYEKLKTLNPLSMNHLLKAHGILTKDLVEESGKWRSRDVGIFKGKEVRHVAPLAKKVPFLMADLFDFVKKEKNLSWLLKACIFHYEFEFIHPFSDGNGRMVRLWQQLLLMKEDPVFEFIPVEVLIRDHQDKYYKSLEDSDAKAESTPFLEFSLTMIHQALMDYMATISPSSMDSDSRLAYTKTHMKKQWFSRKDYLILHKDISSATASRDLIKAAQKGILTKQGENNQVVYCFRN